MDVLTGNNVFTVNYQAAPCKGKLYQYIGKPTENRKRIHENYIYRRKNSGTVVTLFK